MCTGVLRTKNIYFRLNPIIQYTFLKLFLLKNWWIDKSEIKFCNRIETRIEIQIFNIKAISILLNNLLTKRNIPIELILHNIKRE